MEEQNLLGKKPESNSNTISQKKQNMSEQTMPLYSNSYTRTQLQSNIVNYTWEIDDFYFVYNTYPGSTSPPFPITNEYQIKMCFLKEEKKIDFYIISEQPFLVSCSISIKEPYSTLPMVKMFNGIINKDTYLFTHDLRNLLCGKYTISCSLQIFRQFLSNTVHTPLVSINLEKTPLSICSSCNCKVDNTKLIKFIINDKSYSIPKHILYATKSSYFKDLCEKTAKEEMTNEVKVENCTYLFEDILRYIQTGFIKQSVDYKELLKTAHKYDLQDLKLICEEYLLHKVTEKTAVEYIKFALSYDAKCLADHAATIIKLYYDTIICSEEFQLLQQEDCNKINELIAKSESTVRRSNFIILNSK